MQTPFVTTTRERIRTAYQRFENLHPTDDGLVWGTNKTWGEIKKKLKLLDLEIATQKDVASIIGNYSWTCLKCDQCGKFVDVVITVGESPGCESSTASLCVDCLKRAFELLEEKKDV